MKEALFTTANGNKVRVDKDGYIAVYTHNRNTFSGYIVDGEIKTKSILGGYILKRAYEDYKQLDSMITEQGGEQ